MAAPSKHLARLRRRLAPLSARAVTAGRGRAAAVATRLRGLGRRLGALLTPFRRGSRRVARGVVGWCRPRWLQLACSGVLSVVGVLLLLPVLPHTPDPPPSWGLWAGIGDSGPGQRFSTLNADIDVAAEGCDGGAETRLRVALTVAEPQGGRPADARAHPLLVAISGPELVDGSVHVEREGRRTTADVPLAIEQRGRGGSTGLAERFAWDGIGTVVVLLRLHGLASSAGYKTCFASSPQLFELAAVNDAWRRAAALARTAGLRARGAVFLPTQLSSGIIDLTVAEKLPDPATLDADALIVAGGVRMTCSAAAPIGGELDVGRTLRQLATRSNCGSTQLFRASSAATGLTWLTFFGGLVLSAAIAALLEAVFLERRRP
jgi:hypothetical protein